MARPRKPFDTRKLGLFGPDALPPPAVGGTRSERPGPALRDDWHRQADAIRDRVYERRLAGTPIHADSGVRLQFSGACNEIQRQLSDLLHPAPGADPASRRTAVENLARVQRFFGDHDRWLELERNLVPWLGGDKKPEGLAAVLAALGGLPPESSVPAAAVVTGGTGLLRAADVLEEVVAELAVLIVEREWDLRRVKSTFDLDASQMSLRTLSALAAKPPAHRTEVEAHVKDGVVVRYEVRIPERFVKIFHEGRTLPPDPDETTSHEVIRVVLRHFGPLGIRHYASFLIQAHRQGRKRLFQWDLDTHCEIMGYKRNAQGYFETRVRQQVRQFVRAFTNATIELEIRGPDGQQRPSVRGRILTAWWERDSGESVKGEAPEDNFDALTLEWNPDLYRGIRADDGTLGTERAPQLEALATTPNDHPYSVALGAICPIKFRKSQTRGKVPPLRYTVKSLLAMCGRFADDADTRAEAERLLADLPDAERRGFIGRWSVEQRGADVFQWLVSIEPPHFMVEQLLGIERHPLNDAVDPLREPTGETMRTVRRLMNLTQREFAERSAIPERTVQYLESEKRAREPLKSESLQRFRRFCTDTGVAFDGRGLVVERPAGDAAALRAG